MMMLLLLMMKVEHAPSELIEGEVAENVPRQSVERK